VRCALGARLDGLPADQGEVERWWVAPIGDRNVLLLPRRWLIAAGMLSPFAALLPWLRFRLDPHVLEVFWLESEESP